MADLAIWLGLMLLAAAGVAIARFNPLVIYSRANLFRLALICAVAIGVVLGLGFFGAPPVPPSGVSNPNGG
jgi:hypothetical protein